MPQIRLIIVFVLIAFAALEYTRAAEQPNVAANLALQNAKSINLIKWSLGLDGSQKYDLKTESGNTLQVFITYIQRKTDKPVTQVTFSTFDAASLSSNSEIQHNLAKLLHPLVLNAIEAAHKEQVRQQLISLAIATKE